MKYVQFLNTCIKETVRQPVPIVLYGQNIAAGSCLSGLTRGLQSHQQCSVLNTPNCENTLVGVGFGLMLNGVAAVYFMKQQDFLLLGIDQIVNTYNFVRLQEKVASFTIVTIIVDSGYEGMQSSLNNFGDFCSIARVDGYSITNRHDAGYIIRNHLVRPGFRIIGVSQRLFHTDLISCEGAVHIEGDGDIFQYSTGTDVTIACFNLSFPQGFELAEHLASLNKEVSLFSVNHAGAANWDPILKDLRRTRKLVILDDSKSGNRSCFHLLSTAYRHSCLKRSIVVSRECTNENLHPNSDIFKIDTDTVFRKLFTFQTNLSN